MAENLEILIKECKRGRPQSQEALYRRFAPAMYGLCLQYASSEEDARDILQDGFIKVFNKIKQVRNPEAFPGWIRRVMINTALEKDRSHTVLQSLDDWKGGGPEGETEYGLTDLTCEELTGLIRELSPRYRMVFNLYAIEGYTHQEISEKLGISVGTSKSNLSRARAILQERIKAIYGSTIAR